MNSNQNIATDASSVVTAIATGLVAGAIGSFVMTQFQSLLHKAFSERTRGFRNPKNLPEVETTPAPERVAEIVNEDLLGREPISADERKVAGQMIHYAFGSTMGAAYGGLVSVSGMNRPGSGVLFGVALWAIADEMLVPALKLSEPSTRYPIKTHLYALSSHLIYGLTLDAVQLLSRSAISRGRVIGVIQGTSRTDDVQPMRRAA
jgi:putative membrane protein